MLRIARVAAVHPEDHSADIVMVDDGSRHSGVQVMSWTASLDTGTFDLPAPEVPASGDKWSLAETTGRDMIAIVGMVGRLPLVLGFLPPQISQMLFKDQNRRVSRHASDVYSTTDGKGNTEWRHPSGLYIRIATDPAHEDLTGQDVDGKWKIDKNTDQQVHFHAELPGKWSIDIEPSAGDMTLQTVGSVDATIGGHLSADVAETVTVTAGGDTTVTAPKLLVDCPDSTFTGKVTVQGLLTYQAGMAGSGGTGGASATITGNVVVTTGEVSADGIGLKGHHHEDPQGGVVGPAIA